jgi:hypothetical protein
MEKILLLIEAKGINRSSFEFACYLAHLTRSTLTGVFVDPSVGMPALKLPKDTAADELPISATEESESHWKTRLAENRRSFALACMDKSVRWDDQTDAISNVAALVGYTRFADILIISVACSLREGIESSPTQFVKDILGESECPVIIAPDSFSGIDEIVFAYDGSASCLYAIKHFTYLFPKFSDTHGTFLQVINHQGGKITERDKISEYLKAHYSAIRFKSLYGDVSEQLLGYLTGRKNVFVVTGAYGKRIVSSMLKSSTAEPLLEVHNLPLFIAHR